MKTIINYLVLLITLALFATSIALPLAEAGEQEQKQDAEQTQELELEAEAAVLIDAHTGRVLYDLNKDEPQAPASLTKIMTLLLALEAIDEGKVDKDEIVTTSERAWRMGGSQMYLQVGQDVPYWEMIQGIAIISANDACVAIAEHLYGSEEAFVEQMNIRADELGLQQTNFANSHGIPHEDQTMSALDVAKLSRYFIQTQPEGHALESEREFEFNDILQHNRNPLLGRYEGADGLKTGWTGEENAGHHLAATAEKDGFRLISVVLENPNNDSRRRDSKALLDYGFNNFSLTPVAEAEQIVDSVPIDRGVEREIPLAAGAKLETVIPQGEEHNVDLNISLEKDMTAPIQKNEVVGKLQAVLEGETLNEVDLIAAETVEQAGFFTLLFRSISDFFTNLLQGLVSD